MNPLRAPARPVRLLLARHGRSVWNGTKRITGQLDPPLAPKGVEEALELSGLLRDEPLAAVHSSTLARARETARPTAEQHGLAVTECEALRELHCGTLQGRFRDERDPEALSVWQAWSRDRATSRLPGNGESYEDLAARVGPCVASILARLEVAAQTSEVVPTALVVAHRRTNAAFLAVALGWPLARATELRLRHQILYEIFWEGRGAGAPQLRSIRIDGRHGRDGVAGFEE